jgi:hypothetical protein
MLYNKSSAKYLDGFSDKGIRTIQKDKWEKIKGLSKNKRAKELRKMLGIHGDKKKGISYLYDYAGDDADGNR